MAILGNMQSSSGLMSLTSLSPEEMACTSLRKKTISYRWTINGFTMGMKFGRLTSPSFSVLSSGIKASYHLDLNFAGRLYLTLNREDGCSSMVEFWRACVFLNPETQVIIHSIYYDNKLNEDSHRIVLPNNYTDYLYNDTMCIYIEADQHLVVTDGPPDDIASDLHSLYSLYKNEVLTDTIIKCEDGEFKVHRVVLASQSPVFRAMFEVDMKEKQSGVIEVSGITPAVMSDLVAYLYTGTAPNLKTLASELLDVAEMYQLPRLFKLSENELKSKIKENNVIKTLILAELHSKSLKRACVEFIGLNSAKVFQMEEWEKFRVQYASLYMEVLGQLNVLSA